MRVEEVQSGLVARLRARRSEIEQAALTRVQAFSDPNEAVDPEYTAGLKEAVRSAIGFGIEALGRGEGRPTPIPTLLLSQARLAARNRVSLDTVLRRYFAGYALLGDFVIEEAERIGPMRGTSLKRLLRSQAALLDRLLAGVSEEYCREQRGLLGSAGQRRVDHVKRLLAGELLDTSELAYDFEGFHLGVIVSGSDAAESMEALVKSLDCRLLLIHPEVSTVWAWLGSRRKLASERFKDLATRQIGSGLAIAIGEPGEGAAGWRLTHRQARAALPVGLRGAESVVRYAEVAMVASMLDDDLLVTSLRQLYLAPLAAERDGGAIARNTLEAYFAAERNTSSAAAMLGISRQAVGSRLRTIEDRIGRPLSACATEIEAVLRLRVYEPSSDRPG